MSDWTTCEGGACMQYRTEGDTVTIRSTVTAEQMRVTVAEWDAFVAGLTAEADAKCQRMLELAGLRGTERDRLAAESGSWRRVAERLQQELNGATSAMAELAPSSLAAENARLRQHLTAAETERDRYVAAVARARRERATAIAEAKELRTELAITIDQRDEAIAEAAVLRHRDRRTQAVVEAAQVCVAGMRRSVHDAVNSPWLLDETRTLIAAMDEYEERVWNAGDPEPEGVEKVRDDDGVVWVRRGANWTSAVGHGTGTSRWSFIVDIWGPLTEVLPEPAPAADNDHDPDGPITVTMDNTDGRFVPTEPLTQVTFDTETEWGWRRVEDGVIKTPYRSESANRRILAYQDPGKWQLVRRLVGPWQAAGPDGEVPEAGRAGEAPKAAANSPESTPVPGDEVGHRLDAAIETAAEAISRYDWDHQLSANFEVSRHQRAEATAAVRVASPLIERAALLAAADDWMVDWLAEGTGFPENTDAWLKRRATRTEGS